MSDPETFFPYPICTVEDVARYLGSSAPDNTDDLQPYLDEAQDYVQRVADLDFQAVGTPRSKIFSDVREQSRLRIPDIKPAAISVTVTSIANSIPQSSSPPWILSEGNDFILEGDRWVRLTSSMFYRVVGYDYAYGRRPSITWDKVEIHYTASGYVPPTIKEATALIAAAFFKQGPFDTSGFNSERIGDYSYSRNPHAPLASIIPIKARALLRLFRGTRARST